jgi:hypothetical protein
LTSTTIKSKFTLSPLGARKLLRLIAEKLRDTDMANVIAVNTFRAGLAHTQTVAETFISAVNAFNAQKWDVVETLLHPDVIVYNISSVAYVSGLDAAMKYFDSLPKQDPAQFDPTNQMTFFPTVYPLSVRGVALWTHKQHGHVNAPIKYEFQFEPRTFLITSLWAQHSR